MIGSEMDIEEAFGIPEAFSFPEYSHRTVCRNSFVFKLLAIDRPDNWFRDIIMQNNAASGHSQTSLLNANNLGRLQDRKVLVSNKSFKSKPLRSFWKRNRRITSFPKLIR